MDPHLLAPHSSNKLQTQSEQELHANTFQALFILHGFWGTWGTSRPRPVAVCLRSEPSLREGEPNSGDPQAVTVDQQECPTPGLALPACEWS